MPPFKKVKKVMTLPINVIFGHLQVRSIPSNPLESGSSNDNIFLSIAPFRWFLNVLNRRTHTNDFLSFLQQKKTRVRIWLYEDTKMQLEGQIIGFDEYMNMVLDDAVEIGKKRNEVGRILLKGDAITCIQEANPVKKE